MIEEILKDLFDQANIRSKEEINEIIKDLDTLLSGEKYETFLKADVSNPHIKKRILSNFGSLVGAVMLPTQILTEISPEFRERIVTYLNNLLEKITKIISDEKSRILNVQKSEKSEKRLEEMSNDELIDYLFSKLGK